MRGDQVDSVAFGQPGHVPSLAYWFEVAMVVATGRFFVCDLCAVTSCWLMDRDRGPSSLTMLLEQFPAILPNAGF